MKISACVITKNEAKNIGKWLTEMASIADEMIVVDTGSDDATVKIAKNAGAKVYFFKWINDFAAAKNYAIEQASGDWIIFLDADEYFSPETKNNLKKIIERQHKNKTIGSIMCRLTNIDTDNNNRIIDSMIQVRIFRNIPAIRYEGKIHENIKNLHGKRGMTFSSELEILHTGYSSSIIKEKSKRNIEIIKEKQKKEGNTFQVISALMDSYNTLGEYEKAVEYAKLSIENNMNFIGMEGHDYEILFSATLRLVEQGKKDVSELYAVLDEAMEKFPQDPVFPLEKGFVLWQHKDYLKAQILLEKGFKLRKIFNKKSAEGIGLTDNSRRMLPPACAALGNIYYLQKKITLAADIFAQGINIYKYNPALLSGICKCLKKTEDAELIEIICLYYDRVKDAKFICDTIKNNVSYQVYNYFAKNIDKEKSVGLKEEKAQEYIASRYYESAAIVSSKKLKHLYNLSTITCNYINEENTNILKLLIPTEYKEHRNKIKTIERVNSLADSIIADTEEAPLVSIMIPTYNRPVMFEKTLKSALNQTYPNIEILVNDNSTNDETEILMQKYITDPRIKYFRNFSAKCKEDNFIPFKTQARGSMLQWCMDDDILYPHKLQIMTQVLRDNPEVTLVTSIRDFINENDEIISNPDRDYINIDGKYGLINNKDAAFSILGQFKNFIGEPSAVLFRKKDLVHHYWQAQSKGLYTISDVAMWLELMEKGDLVLFKKPLSAYRKHKQQEGQQPDTILLSRLEWVGLIEEYYHRGIFLENEEQYKCGLRSLYDEYLTSYPLLPQFHNIKYTEAYVDAMEKIGEYLNHESI